jgi:hypothetical protein
MHTTLSVSNNVWKFVKGTEKFSPSCGNSVSADHSSYAEIILDITLLIFLRSR